jgi:deoxycytidine triphosphate deaminase
MFEIGSAGRCPAKGRYGGTMLLSDRDLVIEIKAGNLALEPFEPALVQPSSIDVRLDRLFRVFNNHLYTHIDPAAQQDELTSVVEVPDGEPFVLHPGEFVLASTLEVISLGDQLAGRLEGKALAVGTPVPTPTGWTTMGELKIGDHVFGDHGRPVRVVAATEVMTGRPCFRVTFSDGESIVADADHRWLTTTRLERKCIARGTLAGGSVRTTAEIAADLRYGDGEWNHHVALTEAVRYPTRDLPIDPYVLGAWLGDGTSANAGFTCADEPILEEIKRAGYAVTRCGTRYAHRIGAVGHTRDAKTGRYAANESLSSKLRDLGLIKNKHVPALYLTADVAQRTALLQGLMDTDGHVDELGRCEFVSTKEHLADAVLEVAASLGLRPVKRKKRAVLNGADHGPAFQVKFTPHIPVFRLPRKLARQKYGRFHRFRAITDVQPMESVPVRCIQVDDPRGMFLAGRTFVPTHNSSLGRLGLLTHSTAGFIDPGFSGHVTLELSNVANLPITLWPGMKIGQLCIFRLSSPAEHPYGSAVYGSRYQGQRGPTPSRSWQNWRTWPLR